MWFEWSWWSLLLIIPAWFLQLIIHESSHLITAWIAEGWKPAGFRPYPHKYLGRFYFARYSAVAPKGYDFSRKKNLIHIAPFFAGLDVLAIAILIFALVGPQVKPWILPFAVMGLGDALFFWWTYLFGSKYSDGKRWKNGG